MASSIVAKVVIERDLKKVPRRLVLGWMLAVASKSKKWVPPFSSIQSTSTTSGLTSMIARSLALAASSSN